jgi:hypothetical protein
MNKIATTISTIAAVLLAGACSKAVVEQEGSAVTLDYTVSVTEAATKALGDGTNVDKLAYAVYDGETCVKTAVINEQQDGKFAFQPVLYYGKTYTVAMFAYKDGAYNVSDLKAITKSANDETADAFTHTETVMIDHNGDLYINGSKSDDQTSDHAVTLTRPVAQLAVATEVFDEMAEAGAAKIQVELSAPSTYNAVLSAPSTTSATANYTSTVAELGTIEVSGKTYTVVSCNYLLPTDTQTVTVKVLKADDTVIRTITLYNVPLVANKKTQIYGNLVKGELTFNVSINNGFKTEVEEKPVQ